MNWITDYEAKKGKLPDMPVYLQHKLKQGIQVVVPAAQAWNKLSLQGQQIWRETIEWLGEDPNDLLEQMRLMLPRGKK